MNELLLELNDVSYIRGGKAILKRVSWHVAPGENWILFGRNGAGKTMLLELITGYLQSSGGSIRRFGIGYGEGYDIRTIRRQIGYVSTPLAAMIPKAEPLLYVVIGGVDASAGLWRKPSTREREQAAQLLGQIGMGDRLMDPFGILSDGERQKILMLRALINDPQVLILDEPTRGLDFTSREDVLSAMTRLCKAGGGASIIYVTHHTDEIVPIFDKIMILEQGAVHYSGDIDSGLTSGVLTGIFRHELEIVKLNGRFYTVAKG